MTAPGDIPTAELHVISGGGTSVNDPHSSWMPNALERVGALLAGAIAASGGSCRVAA